MINAESNIKHQFDGFLNTPNLWRNRSVYDLEQLESEHLIFNNSILKQKLSQRLGNRVEQFFFNSITKSKRYQVIKENFQIIDKKVTIGELDALLWEKNNPIHLEIVYKFYLYDKTVGSSELDCWIGPNRNDSLINKLNKLTNKQLPLLHNPITKRKLNELNIDYKYTQKICFKAQLFTPYKELNQNIKLFNKNCIKGYYINVNQLDMLKSKTFFIPNKLDWLSDPYDDVEWLDYFKFKKEVIKIINQQKSPLCWFKNKIGIIEKFFVVWW